MSHTDIGKPRSKLLREKLTTPIRANSFDLIAILPFSIGNKLTHSLGSFGLSSYEIDPGIPGIVINDHQDIPVLSHG